VRPPPFAPRPGQQWTYRKRNKTVPWLPIWLAPFAGLGYLIAAVIWAIAIVTKLAGLIVGLPFRLLWLLFRGAYTVIMTIAGIPNPRSGFPR
jgi:hypothetical protein